MVSSMLAEKLPWAAQELSTAVTIILARPLGLGANYHQPQYHNNTYYCGHGGLVPIGGPVLHQAAAKLQDKLQ